MWHCLALSVIMICGIGEAQRSFYAPRPGSHSKVLPRFRIKEEEAIDGGTLEARGAENNENNTFSTLPPQLRGTLEDNNFVRRVSEWPQDRQPFWFKNRHALSLMRGKESDGKVVSRTIYDRNQRPVSAFRTPFFRPGSLDSNTATSRSSTSQIRKNNNSPIVNSRDKDPLIAYLKFIQNKENVFIE